MRNHRNDTMQSREIIFLVVLSLVLFMLFNILNFSSNRWTLHPDDHDVFMLSRVLLKTGHLWFESPENEEFQTTAFQPGLKRFNSDETDRYAIRASYSPGIYLLTAPGHIAGLRGPFMIIGLLGISGVLCLYFFTREVFDRATAMIASLFIGFSAPYAYWSNMLFSNIPALALFTGGLCFLARIIKRPGKRPYYFLSVTLFILAIWMRYDYALLVALVGVVTLACYRSRLRPRLLLESGAVAFLLVSVIGLINLAVTRSPIGIRGTYGAGKATGGDILRYIPKLSIGVMLANARMYVFWVAPVMVVLGVLGSILIIKNKRSGFGYMLVLLPLLVLFLYGKSDGFWGFDKNWLASSYTRYFLPLFMCLAILAAAFVVWLVKQVPWRALARTGAVLLISVHVVTSAYVLFNNQFGLKFTDHYSGNRKSVDAFFSSVSDSAVVVDLSSDDYFRFDIISRTVLNPSYFEEEKAQDKLASIIAKLAERGTDVFVINNPERSMIDPQLFQDRFSSMKLNAVVHPVEFRYGSRTPDIYRVEVNVEAP